MLLRERRSGYAVAINGYSKGGSLEDASRCSFAKCKVRVHEYLDDSLAVFHGPRRLQAVVLAKPEENKEVDFSDAFIALNPNSVWQDEGETSTPPYPDTGCHTALRSLSSVALSSGRHKPYRFELHKR